MFWVRTVTQYWPWHSSLPSRSFHIQDSVQSGRCRRICWCGYVMLEGGDDSLIDSLSDIRLWLPYVLHWIPSWQPCWQYHQRGNNEAWWGLLHQPPQAHCAGLEHKMKTQVNNALTIIMNFHTDRTRKFWRVELTVLRIKFNIWSFLIQPLRIYRQCLFLLNTKILNYKI